MGRKNVTVPKIKQPTSEVMKAHASLVMHMPVLKDPRFLNDAVYNPRKISVSDFNALKHSIRTHGFLDPIVIQKEGKNIIAGHQRKKALFAICTEDGIPVPKVPTIILDVDDRAAKKLNIALNKVGGEFDAHLLGKLLADLNQEKPLQQDELATFGFYQQSEADKLLRLVDAIPPLDIDTDEPKEFGRSVTLSFEFNDTRLRDLVKKTIVEKAATANKKTGDLLASLLGVSIRS